jgi:hypothetical protein
MLHAAGLPLPHTRDLAMVSYRPKALEDGGEMLLDYAKDELRDAIRDQNAAIDKLEDELRGSEPAPSGAR